MVVSENHVKWVLCHHSMLHLQVVVGGDGLRIWRLAMNMLNEQLQTADGGWPSSLGVGWGVNNLPL
jgi:hypothetical protein